ncbi:ribonuclease HII [Telmatospirillum sp.]|uniref:ribonuclease HII n=1 Tax=Telmatospirillum sp. TaxID=2079197 RepID=UPI00284BD937|nr:ribonuclease HII [Telmatospirillum sp.]MDR3435969.1 ribonuclease HII [Telmatospirillum sp.]
MPPDFSFEQTFAGTVCGIDEVGRGPLAGPVFAAAVVLPRDLPPPLDRELDDSKRLSAKKRERLADIINGCAFVGIGQASVAEIDQVNILQATFLAMGRALDALRSQTTVDQALVDGNQRPPLPCPVQCIVKGDSRSLSIAAASVVAKVTRDRLMTELATVFPGYGWERNAGYGTAEHRDALGRLGITPHHRRSFAPIADLIGNR